MLLIRQLLTCLCVPAFIGCAAAATAPNHYLTPATPYDFSGAKGDYVQLPSGHWTVFNASRTEDEGPRNYWVTDSADRPDNKDDAGVAYPEGMLRFQGQLADVNTYLALSIRNTDGAAFRMLPTTVPGADGIPVIPVENRIRADVLHMTLCFSVSDTAPAIHALQYMYRKAEDRLPESRQLPVAAKLGLYVGMDGYFYFTRVVPVSEGSGTGRPQDTQILFCKSLHPYSEFGSGEVTVEVEFRTFASEVIESELDPSGFIPQASRAYRILIYKGPYDPAKPAAEKTVLTEGRGYRLTMVDPDSNKGRTESTYVFDFSTLDQGEWIFPIDDTTALSNPQDGTSLEAIDIYGGQLDTLDSVGFSAQSGGFVSAHLTTADALVSNTSLMSVGVDAGSFAPYLNPQAPAYDLYTSWAGRYGVNLMDYVGGSVVMSLDASRQLSDQAFNAFLLDMDPAAHVEQKLIVTGVVTGESTVTLSVVGPEGSNLASALNRAAALRIRRSATPEGVASAEPRDYAFRMVPYSTDGSVAFVLPKEEADGELPFMKVELVARELPDAP